MAARGDDLHRGRASARQTRAPTLPYPPITTTRMDCPSRAERDRSRGSPDLISRVYATVAAGFAPHLHAGERRKLGLQVLPDPHGDILQARDLEAVDLVQVFVVQPLAERQAAP